MLSWGTACSLEAAGREGAELGTPGSLEEAGREGAELGTAGSLEEAGREGAELGTAGILEEAGREGAELGTAGSLEEAGREGALPASDPQRRSFPPVCLRASYLSAIQFYSCLRPMCLHSHRFLRRLIV